MHDGGGWWVMMLMMTLVWLAFIVAAVWVVRELVGRRGDAGTPERLLAERLASGEISVEEYEQRREALSRQ
jgi:putative membrane protein